MFNARYFASRYYPLRYFPKVGGIPTDVRGALRGGASLVVGGGFQGGASKVGSLRGGVGT
jgi:hypothetical protein